jgi:hypothetical protein
MSNRVNPSTVPRTPRRGDPGSIGAASGEGLECVPTMEPGSAPRYARLGRGALTRMGDEK